MGPSRTLPRQLALLVLAGAAGVSGAVPPCAAGPAAGNHKVKGSLQATNTQRITLDFVEAELTDVAKALSVQSGVNIAVSSQAKGKITLRLRNTTLEEALRFISRLAGVDYRRFDQTYVIGTPEELRSMVARSGATETWTPKYIKPEEAQGLVQGALPYVTCQAMPSSRNVLLLGSPEDLAAARRLLETADQPGPQPTTPAETTLVQDNRVTRIFTLKYLDPALARKSLLGDGKGEDSKSMFPDLAVAVGPDPFSPKAPNFSPLSIETRETFGTQKTEETAPGNRESSKSRTLILSGPAEQVSGAIQLLQSLDVAPPQVMIEARLVDISPEKFRELGLEYSFPQYGFRETPLRDGTEDPPGGEGTVDTGGSALKFGRFLRLPFDFDVTLRALETQRFAKLLANPRISVIDSEDASIFIGDLLRFRVLQSVTAAGSQFTVQTVPVGVALLVRPRIHDDGHITMKVHPVVSTVTSFVGPEQIPQTASREADSTIRMKDGETVAIGGLLREEELRIMRSVPILSKLPLIGELFKSRTTNRRKSEVTVFLTAKIMR